MSRTGAPPERAKISASTFRMRTEGEIADQFQTLVGTEHDVLAHMAEFIRPLIALQRPDRTIPSPAGFGQHFLGVVDEFLRATQPMGTTRESIYSGSIAIMTCLFEDEEEARILGLAYRDYRDGK